MVKRIALISLIGALGLGAASFMGGCRHGAPHKGAVLMMDYLTEALDLNEEQQTLAESYRDEILSRVLAARSEKQALHDEIKAQLGSEAIDTTRMKSLLAEHRAKMDDVVELAVDRVAEFHQVLTPEQRRKLVSKLEKFDAWHRHEWRE